KLDLAYLPDADPARRHAVPREEGQHRSRRSLLISKVEMVGARIIEIDGLLDEPESKDRSVEIEIAAGVSRDGRNVMDAVALHDLSLSRLAPKIVMRNEFSKRRAVAD